MNRLFKFLIFTILFCILTSCNRTPQDKFKTAILIDSKDQNFGDCSNWFHFTVDSIELKNYLKDFEIKGNRPFDEIDFEFFCPQEAPTWWQLDKLGKEMKAYRRDSDRGTEFFYVNKLMTEVYYQNTTK